MISVESQKKITPQPPYQPLGWSYRYYIYNALFIARRGKGIPGQKPGYPRALRSRDHPMGIEGLAEGEKEDVELSNALGTFAKDLLQARKVCFTSPSCVQNF